MKDPKNVVTPILTKYFSGQCDSCGEIYEAQSKTDDLGGIKFRCRKMKCGGQVLLEDGKSSPFRHRKPISMDSNRFC